MDRWKSDDEEEQVVHHTCHCEDRRRTPWSPVESSPSFLSVECKWIQIDSCRALPNILCHPTMFVFSHCLVDSEVAFGSVAMCFLKMQWPPSTSATCHGVVGRPSSCHDVSSRDIQYLVVSMVKERCHHDV